MKAAHKVYLEVAENYASGVFNTSPGSDETEGVCDALHHKALETTSPMRLDLREEFQDYFVTGEDYFLISNVCDSPEEAKHVRIMCLCLLAAITAPKKRKRK